jgi:hypothetical protein
VEMSSSMNSYRNLPPPSFLHSSDRGTPAGTSPKLTVDTGDCKLVLPN